jgi:CubicO group peptidase (beta-lactamase class C family)
MEDFKQALEPLNDPHQMEQLCLDSNFRGRAAVPEATMPLERARHSYFLGLLAACAFGFVLAGCAPQAETGARGTVSPAMSAVENSAAAGPRFAQGGPDAEEYGASQGFPLGDRATCLHVVVFLVGCHSHFDQVYESRLVHRATTPSPLARSASEPSVRYEYQGEKLTLDDYLARNPAMALLVARGDTILVERYQYGRHDRHRFTSMSMAKTVTAMLIGIAIAERHIHSVDDPASAYVPALAGTEYGRTSLRDLLQMSSGVRFVEEYTGKDDISRLAADTLQQVGSGGVEAVRPFNARVAPSGARFNYASVETQVLGLVLRNAVGRPVADYLQHKIWQPMGAEADATWIIDRAGQEATYCCFNAVLRDYARLGLLLAQDGTWQGRQVIPAAWIKEATIVHPGQPQPRAAGYGYQVWILAGERRMFALRGLRGQAIYIDPTSRLVMVHTAVRKRVRDPGILEENALWRGIVQQFGH